MAMAVVVAVAGCGDSSDIPSSSDDPAGPAAQLTASSEADGAGVPDDGDGADDQAGAAVGAERPSIEVCGPVIAAGDDIVAAAGFETAGADQHTELANGLCRVSGLGNDEVTVELVPEIFPSIDLYTEGFDTPAEAAPELGDDARYIPGQYGQRIVFPFVGRAIDVRVSSSVEVERDQIVAAALAVREVLTAAG